MFPLQKIFIFILFLNIIPSLISFSDENSKSNNEHSIIFKTFEELDKLMSHSEFNKVWENFRENIKKGEINNEFISEELKNNEKYEYFENTNNDEIILGSTNSDTDTESCLMPKEETAQILKDKYGINDNNPQDEVRFITGKCHPVILIPGMLSTKLQVRINCHKLYKEEKDTFKKIRFYCGKYICHYPEDNYNEEHDLFISGLGYFGVMSMMEDLNKYSGCLGYFLTFFNTKDVCSPNEEQGHDKYVCNYSKYIKIGYYGSTEGSKNNGRCGLNAIQNVVMAGGEFIENMVNTGILRSYKPLIDKLIGRGYKPGFSLGGIPNDYRRFLANNVFTTNTFRYQIENLYKNTGKSVVIIGHSYGTITTLSNLVKEENSDLLSKIKKFIAVGPPFAGSSELIKRYFGGRDLYKKEINLNNLKNTAQFDEFGFGMVINKLPTVFELRPLPILGKLLNDPQYQEFGEAIKERLYLEKECGHQTCSDDKISQNSVKFDTLFKGYFPSLTDSDCKFEKNLEETSQVFNRKCLAEMFNLGDCPMVIGKRKDDSGNLPNLNDNELDKYCKKNDDNLFYQIDCKNNESRKCLDELYYTKSPYPFDTTSEKAKFFINNYKNNKFNEEFGEVDFNEYPSLDEYLSAPRKQIDFYNQISLTKDMPVPTIDTDIVYGNYAPTVTAFIYNENDYSKQGPEYRKGGDGVVPNWSPIIPGLKWIYETKKYNLKNKIRLIEFCSRLGRDSKYAYDKNKKQDFAALTCECINDKNMYTNNKENDCSHGLMISDKFFIEYVYSIIEDQKEEDKITDERIKAVKNFDPNFLYENKCNEKLREILDSEN